MISERGLAPGTILYDRYVIGKVLGEGGFGITYQATIQSTGEVVAIKEYFPLQFAVRQKESCDITVLDAKKETEYVRGKERFVKEASILKEYQYLQGIVKVWDYFETNHTAYIIMEYIDGVTLKEYVSCHGGLEYSELMEMLSPVMKSLIALHRHGVIHRDISPDNLMIGMDNGLYLIDFGAAKVMENGKTTTVMLTAGYAPPEQYLHDGDLGAWTDVYALCATIYTALSGKVPVDAVARLQGKMLIPLSEYGVELESWQWNTILKGMSMRAAERFRHMEDLYDALTIEPSTEEIKTITGVEVDTSFQEKMQTLNEVSPIHTRNVRKKKNVRIAGFSAVFACALLVVILYGSKWERNRDKQSVGEQIADTVQNGMEMDVTQDKGQRIEDSVAQDAEQRKGDNIAQGTTVEKIQAKLCVMPDVIGKTENAAKSEITEGDSLIAVRITRVYSNETARDVVVEQSVKPDTQYNEGAIQEVELTVSDGPAPVATAARNNDSLVKKEKKSTEEDYFKVESDGNEMVDIYLDE